MLALGLGRQEFKAILGYIEVQGHHELEISSQEKQKTDTGWCDAVVAPQAASLTGLGTRTDFPGPLVDIGAQWSSKSLSPILPSEPIHLQSLSAWMPDPHLPGSADPSWGWVGFSSAL